MFFILLFSMISFISIAQTDGFYRVDNIFSAWDHEDSPGCALGVVKEGKLIYSRGYGSADLEHNISITPSSVFYIGSVSKQFVTFCILLLEEKGKLDLDDKIQKYFPDFPDYGYPLTIRHFIHHTSGVRDYLTLLSLKGRNYLDHTEPEEVYELIRNQKELNFIPGEKYLYSNSCYFMLALIIEKASGQSIKEYARTHIFEPLGMKNTQFYDDITDLIKNRVFSYEVIGGKKKYNNLVNRFDLVGSGGVYSTAEDLFLWDQNFYHNILGKGEQQIIEKMHEEGLLNSGESSGYAFAINNGKYKGLRTVSHGGSLAGYRANLLRFPDQQFSVILLANRHDARAGEKVYQVADIFLEKYFLPEEKKLEAKNIGNPMQEPQSPDENSLARVDVQLKDYEGKYYSEEIDATYSFEIKDSILYIQIPHTPPLPLAIKGKDNFSTNGNYFRFIRRGDNITGFTLDAGRVTHLKFEKK